MFNWWRCGPWDVLKSTDQGKTWERTNLNVVMNGNDFPGELNGERLIVDPNDSNVLYFGSRRFVEEHLRRSKLAAGREFSQRHGGSRDHLRGHRSHDRQGGVGFFNNLCRCTWPWSVPKHGRRALVGCHGRQPG
jgi:hypothetical protein